MKQVPMEAMMVWTLAVERLRTLEEMKVEWHRGLQEKSLLQTDAELETWCDTAAELRSSAAALRDSYLQISPEYATVEEFVQEISLHLPERRTGNR